MSIPVTPDNSPYWEPAEHCCFCFKAARHWYVEKDVAVCLSCAEIRDPEDVPTKAAWCAEVHNRFFSEARP